MSIREELLEPIDRLIETEPIPKSELIKQLDAVRERNELFEARLNQLQLALTAGRREEALLEDLLALRNGELKKGNVSVAERPESVSEQGRTPHPVVEATVDILKHAGRPIHISELMTTLTKEEVQIPGSGDQANLISHLRRDPRIARPARGLYGLREWGLEDLTTTRKRRTRRRAGTKGKQRKG